jgi:hypothetical protein
VKIAPSTYYATKSRPPSARSVTDAATTAVIERVHAENFGVYGARKVHAELRRQDQPVARCTVERLMRTAGLRGITRTKGPRTTQGRGKVLNGSLACSSSRVRRCGWHSKKRRVASWPAVAPGRCWRVRSAG